MEFMILSLLGVFFFFKQKTAYEMRISDWSSDVCSSDLMDRLDALTALETAINASDAESEADITLELDAAIDALGAAYVAVERAREERPCAGYWTPERSQYRAMQMGSYVA